MENFQTVKTKNIDELPRATGVYIFLEKGRFLNAKHSRFSPKARFLYIGKANEIRKRVKSHFQQPTHKDKLFLRGVKNIAYTETGSEIEALILEANLIKKHQPKYNVLWKDDKYFSYAAITKEVLPRIYVVHQKKNEKRKSKYIGPFIDGRALRKTLRLLRRIFPYYTAKNHPKKPCTWCQIHLCPGPAPDKTRYKKNLKGLISILRGGSKKVLRGIGKEMESKSKMQDFEVAADLRDKFNALSKILAHGKVFERMKLEQRPWKLIEKELKKIFNTKKKISRIEAYDVSNTQGQNATSSMVTFVDGLPNKNFYRKFKIKISGKPNDFAMIHETIQRRMTHAEWGLPDIMLIDGGKPQLSAAKKALGNKLKNVFLMAIAKRNNELFIEKSKPPILLKNLPQEVSNIILHLRDESHRFAIAYHKKLRKQELLK